MEFQAWSYFDITTLVASEWPKPLFWFRSDTKTKTKTQNDLCLLFCHINKIFFFFSEILHYEWFRAAFAALIRCLLTSLAWLFTYVFAKTYDFFPQIV